MTVGAGTGLTGPAQPAAVLALARAAEDVDGVAPLGEQNLLAIRHGTAGYRHHWLADEDLVGYAVIDPAGSAELVVHPEHRRQGWGGRLLETIRADEPDLAVWAHGDLPGAQALARSAGLRLVRELWQMGRELDPAEPASDPGRPAPDGVGVRTFVPGQDDDAWVALNARAFADHPEQGRLTVTDLRERQAEPWFAADLFWLAHEADAPSALLASMWVKVEGDTGEIYALGVDPAAQGRGLGGWLTQIAMAAMTERGLRQATLYVEGDNTAAIRTYQRVGFTRTAVDTQYAP